MADADTPDMLDTAPPPAAKPRKLEGWDRLVARHPGWTGGLIALSIALLLALEWLMWAVLMPDFPESTRDHLGETLLTAGMGVLCAFVSLALLGFVFMLANSWVTAAFSSESEELQAARQRARDTEDQVLRELEGKDDSGLLQLQRYSRAQLEAYYQMGLQQTRRSFVNATLSMWLGFLILLAGVSLYIGPFEKWGMRPTGDFNTIVLASATIVEVIAALFLWVYRSTIGQLTFYYRLQMQSHTSILCYRMAATMREPDAAKHEIITQLLKRSLIPERPPATSAQGLKALLPG